MGNMHRNPVFIGSSYIGDAFFHMKDIMSEAGITSRGGESIERVNGLKFSHLLFTCIK